MLFCFFKFIFFTDGNNIGMLLLLLRFIKNHLDQGRSLTEAFKDFAATYSYTPKSVRKCFYSALKGFENHPSLLKRLEIDISVFKNPANAFNVHAVKRYIDSNGGNLDKCFFALCLGDKHEASALRARFNEFYPDFKETHPAPSPSNEDFFNSDNFQRAIDENILKLQANYFNCTPSARV